MPKKEKEYTYREYLEETIVCIQDALKKDNFDWTSKYAQSYLNVSIGYLEKARELIEIK